LDTNQPDPALDRGQIASQVSRQIVQLHARLFGRGPTRAKTYIEDDYVLCVLEEIFTPAELTLIRADQAAQVEATRRAFQEAVKADLVEVVEKATGGTVRALMSQVDINQQIAVELFFCEPRSEPDAAGEV
jgi:uncharacterized protein YbcI